jgi:GTP-binding protein EngB required for normal cell division
MTTNASSPSVGVATCVAAELSVDERLQAYTRLKLKLAAQIRLLREAVHRQGDDRRVAHCAALMVKLAEDRFTLAVLGQFKRGKSSLMNSIIGRELLPVGVRPLTSAITVLRYGSVERLLIQRQHWTSQQEVPVEQLADYVTERGNPSNREQVTAAYLELPLPFLRRGLEFVDTPGVGSSVAANTATTYGFLPQCDAALFVTSAEAPLNRMELEFLRDVRRHASKMFFVINKIDLLGDADRIDVLEFVRTTLETQAGISAPRLFPISALQGLEAKQRGDEALLARCGLAELESALADFLTHQKTEVFFDSVLRKAEHLVKGAEVESEIGRRSRLTTTNAQPGEDRKLEAAFQRLTAEREQVFGKVRERIVQGVKVSEGEIIESFLQSRHRAIMRYFDRLWARAGRVSAAALSERLSGFAGQQFDRAMWRDLGPSLSSMAVSLVALTEPEQRTLAANLNGIAEAAASLYGILPVAEEPGDLLPAIEDPLRRLPMPARENWKPPVASPIFRLPAIWYRNRLRKVLDESSHRWLKDCGSRLLAAVGATATEVVDLWAGEVTSVASALEARVRPMPGDGPTSTETGETAILTSIGKNLERLRQESALLGDGSVPGEDDFRERPDVSEAGDVHANHFLGSEGIGLEQLAADLRIRGCPVCAHLARVNMDFMSHWQYEIFSSESAQRQFTDELGFCSRHQWQLEAISSPVGISVGQARLIRRVGHILEQAARQTPNERNLNKLTSHNRPCRVCALQEKAEQEYIGQIAAFVGTELGRNAYASAQGLCLHHLGRLLSAVSDEEIVHFILACGGRRWTELAEDMESFGMKTEALRRQLRNRNEEDAFWRANILLAGSRSLCLPWPKED